nr:MAG TPA: Portal protein, Peptidoglycan hydrolase gp4, portal, tailspike, adhesin, VIRAL.5A [Caudoviricetes sp.]
MDEKELKETETWQLFEKGRDYLRLMNVYNDTDRNYQFYNGDQWEGAKIDGIEPVQYNFIETIVDYKLGKINANEWGIVFSSDNFDRDFRPMAEKTCELLNKKARKVWERDKMDAKVRIFTEDSAVNSEGIIYADYDLDNQSPINEVLNKCDVHYGNEQSEDIQSQPYILVSKRVSVIEAREFAKSNGATEEEIAYICGDNDSFESAGKDAKYEKDPMCTIVTKMWKEKGTVWFSKSVKYLEISKAKDSKLTLYPLVHFLWKHKKGSARGEGEVKYLIPNQLEENKTLARSALSIKQNAYPQKVADISKIVNPSAIGQVGGVIKAQGAVDNVKNIFGYVEPAQMSADVFKFMSDLISVTREIRNASDIATGGINPEDASGRAILAVQQASEQPLAKQTFGLKDAIEDLARIWLDQWTVYTPEGMTLEEEMVDEETGETYTQLVQIPESVLTNLRGSVTVDITPKSAYDKYAKEVSIENLLKAGYFNAQRLSELKTYVQLLDDDSVMPKNKLEEAISIMEDEQMKIAQMRADAQTMQMRANAYLNATPDDQAQQVAEAGQQVNEEAQLQS